MKVSIITTCYNRKHTIGDAIESVMSQTYPHIEHIIVDGASSDGTMDVVNRYKNHIDHIISEPDSSMFEALNKGIAISTGDIIGMLHSDDLFYDPYTIEAVVADFQKTQSDLIYGNGIYVKQSDLSKVKRIYTAKCHKNHYLYFGWIPLHTTIYVKRSIFSRYGLYDTGYHIASDYEMSLRWFTNDDISKRFINRYLVKMRLGGLSTSPALQIRKSAEDIRIIRKYRLWRYVTLSCKIGRKIPQYILPLLQRTL